MEFRRQWLNYILRQSSLLFYLKQRLLVVHGFEALKLVLRVWLRELLLGIISFPAFLFLNSAEVPSKDRPGYRQRRMITLVVLIPLALVWFARIGIGMAHYVQGSLQEFSQGPSPGRSNSASKSWQKLSGAIISGRFSAPTIYNTSSLHVVSGSGVPSTTIVVSFLKQEVDGGLLFFETASDARGNWSVDRSMISAIPAGSYMVSAIAYDETLRTKSASSPSVEVDIAPSWREYMAEMTDYIIYGTIGLLIALAIITSVLNL